MAKIVFWLLVRSVAIIVGKEWWGGGGGGVKNGQKVPNEVTQELVRLAENFVQLFPVFQGTFSLTESVL